ncbi:hypothetical protein QVD17_36849 [Tagetes erecta]|uniref:LOB domain-containing protein n=1 Tax=Tagetes erecta TaxID=13708 RepID=A0AAD8NHT1_TARER|nr:hypothetical protein QVD17_36849 [Tagetes erecta]
MSCNGCRILRKGCSDHCILRPCLQSFHSPQSQAHATLFLAKFFGRTALFSLISSVPVNQRPSLFRSLLFEAAGRTVNPVNGAVGLLWSGNWDVCQASVDTVLQGGTLRPIVDNGLPIITKLGDSSQTDVKVQDPVTNPRSKVIKRRRDLDLNQSFSLLKDWPEKRRQGSSSINSDESSMTTMTCLEGEVHLLNLFK